MADSQGPSMDTKTTINSSANESHNIAIAPSNFSAPSSVGLQAATSQPGVIAPLFGEELKQALIARIEQVFTRDFLSSDVKTASKMANDLSLPVAEVMDIPWIKGLTHDLAAVTEAILSTNKVIYNSSTQTVKPIFKLERNTIILRDCPEATTAEDIRSLLADNATVTAAIKEVKREIQNSWFLSFQTEEVTLTAYNILREKQLHDQPVRPRIKSETLLKGTGYVPLSAQMYTQSALQQQQIHLQQQQAFANGYHPYPPRPGPGFRGGYKHPSLAQPVAQPGQAPQEGVQDATNPNYRGQKPNRGGFAQRRPPRGTGAPRGTSRAASNANSQPNGTQASGQRGSTNGNTSNNGNNGQDAKRAGRGRKAGQNQANANGANAKRPAGAKAAVVQPPLLGSSHFPPLGTQTAASGYQKTDVRRYSKEQIISIITSTKDVAKADFEVADCPVVSPTPVADLETTKPVPANTQLFEASKSGRRSSNGQQTKSPAKAAASTTPSQPTAASIVAQSIPPQQHSPTEKKANGGGSPKAAAKKPAAAPPKKSSAEHSSEAKPVEDKPKSSSAEKKVSEEITNSSNSEVPVSSTPSYADIAKSPAEVANEKSKKAASPAAKKAPVATANGTASPPTPTQTSAAAPAQPPAPEAEKSSTEPTSTPAADEN